MNDLSPREFGRLEARVDIVEMRLARIEEKLDEILERTNVARGGIRMLIGIGAISASVGAGISALVQYLHK